MALTKRLVKGSAITAAEHDANLDHVQDRANHTGTQTVSTLSDINSGDNLLMTAAERSKVAGLDAAVVLQGEWDASAGTFPGGGTAQAGAAWIVSVGGTVDGETFAVGDRIIAVTDDASTGTFAANWFHADYTDAVSNFADLADVNADTPTDGDIIVWRDASGAWVKEAKPAGGSNPAINDVTDITITSVADNEVLAFDSGSGEWINQTPAEAGLAATSDLDPSFTALAASRDTTSADDSADIECTAAATLTVVAGTITRGCTITQMGAGAATIAAGAGVTINKESDVQAVTNGQNAVAFLKPTSTVDTFILTGSLAAV